MRLYLLVFIALSLGACRVSKKASDSNPISHSIWDSLLQKHVSEAGWVDYPGFIADSNTLNQYLDLLSSAHPNDKNWSEDEQLAYWINAYNAFTVKLIIDHYPVKSIKDIKKGIPFVNTVWDIKFINIEGHEYDLNNIEHGIIRAHFDEPRIHFAVNCASVSCPPLLHYAYTPEKLDQQLTSQARRFLADESRNKVSEGKVSSIFTWFKGDFKGEAGSLVAYINKYAPVQLDTDTKLEFLDYDWNLNEQSK